MNDFAETVDSVVEAVYRLADALDSLFSFVLEQV